MTHYALFSAAYNKPDTAQLIEICDLGRLLTFFFWFLSHDGRDRIDRANSHVMDVTYGQVVIIYM